LDTVRCFVAVFLHQSLHREITTLQKRLSHSGADIKWVEPCNLHFTLQFLGDVEETRIPAVSDALRKCVADFHSFKLQLDSVGAFPNLHNPRVLWVGVGSGKEQLTSLSSTIEEAMKMQSFKRDKRGYSPHLTIGRVRSSRNLKALHERLDSCIKLSGNMEVREIQFTASELTPKGAIYTPIDVIPLNLPCEA
jgi:2'-5' RNA ligase